MTDHMNSSEGGITYKRIRDRALQDAKERMPDWPKESTDYAWQAFIHDLEDLDVYVIAHQSCEWDWVIYYHRAMEVCQAVPSDVLHDAESQWHDMGGPGTMGDCFGLYEMAVRLASLIGTSEIAEAVEQAREELLELANDNLDQL